MTNTQKLIEEKFQHFCNKWNWTKDSGLTFNNKAEVVKIDKWLKDALTQVAEAAKVEERERLFNSGWIMAPAAYRGGNDKKLLQVYAPMWEKNMEMLIEVCLCDKCPDSVPRLNEMAKDFNLALFCKDDDGKYVSVKALLNNHDQK